MTKAKKKKTSAAAPKLTGPSTVQERKWRAQDDARILAQAQAIKGDKKRMAAAAREAKIMLKEKKKELQGLARVAGSSKGKKK